MARIELLPKTRYRVYLGRARDFAGQMERAAEDRAWNSVGLLAVHCVISACDALAVERAGRRWSGQDHSGVLAILDSLRLPGSTVALRQVSEVLSMKSRVEYEAREFTEREAQKLRLQATRVIAWAVGLLPE